MMAQRQRGVALLVALLVVALATVLIASLLDSGQLSLARTRNLLRGEQANAYAQGLEAYAAKVLIEDSNSGNDSNSDSWAVPMPPTPVPGGIISGTLREMNGCFNLNNLVRAEHPEPEWIARFRRLLMNLQLQPAIADAVVDWIDADQTSRDSGAEDGVYLGRQPAYRSAGRAFTSVSELRLVAGVDAHSYEVLEPYVCALPTTTILNLNTASVPVLMSLAPDITQSIAARLYNNGHADYTSVASAMNVLQRAGVRLSPKAQVGLGVNSDYFTMRAQIELDGIDFVYRSLIQRDQGVRVLWRKRGEGG